MQGFVKSNFWRRGQTMLQYLSGLFLSVAQTSDEAQTGLWLTVMGIAGAVILGGLIFIFVRRKKDAKSDDAETSGGKKKAKAGKAKKEKTELPESEIENKESEE